MVDTNGNGKRDITITLKVVAGGYAGDVTVECQIDHIPALVDNLAAAGVTPAQSPYLWEQHANGNGTEEPAAPLCPVHGSPMKPSTKGGGWFCPRKIADGSYCKERV